MASFDDLKTAVRNGNRDTAESVARALYEDGFDFVDGDGESTVWIQVNGLTIGVTVQSSADPIRIENTAAGTYETPDGELIENLRIPVRANPDAYNAVLDEIESWQ